MKINRQEVHDKYNGHCAYCGRLITIKEMQVDQRTPLLRGHDLIIEYKTFVNADDNKYPACRCCNIRKGSLTVTEFRNEIKRDIFQLRRDNPKFRTVERFGLIEVHDNDVVFYYEKHRESSCKQEK